MRKIFQLITFLALAVFPLSGAPAAPQAPWQTRVDAWVLDTSAAGETEFLVLLKSQADLSGASRAATKVEKGAFVYRQLTETARRTQGPLLSTLRRLGLEYRPYWVANLVWVRGDGRAVQALAHRPDVAHIYANPAVRAEESTGGAAAPESTQAVEWNIAKVGAPQVWAAGITGQGVTIGGQDTGYQWDHPALKNQYRGWDGKNADHNYNWHDAIHKDEGPEGPNPCGYDSSAPCDDGGHGTHTMGTMVGSESSAPGDSGENQIGMAPGARWIGCRNMDNGWGTPESYLECYQWFIAPTNLNGENPDPSRAPDVINNSWSCPTDEGCIDPNVLKSAVEAVRAAGILTVQSAGNGGFLGCYTVSEPAAIYDASFSVGATDSADQIAPFSSRGPVTADSSGRLKPDVSAPGVGIRSSVPQIDPTDDDPYRQMSGTSMAGPHVAGLAALLISADPGLSGDVDKLESLITGNALPLQTEDTCGGTAGEIPNNVYGWGRIDAWSAFQEARREFSLSFTPDHSGSTGPGRSIAYSHILANTGLQADTYQLTFESSQGWSVDLTSPLTLQPGEVVTVNVVITAPQDSPIGTVDTTRLTAVSQGNPQISAEVTNTTRVLYQKFLTGLYR